MFGDKDFDKEGGQSNLVLMKLTYQSIPHTAQFKSSPDRNMCNVCQNHFDGF